MGLGRLLFVLLAASALSACGTSSESRTSTRDTPVPEGDHVVAVTLLCRYVAVEGGTQVTREGEGELCTPAGPHTVGGVTVLRVFDVRALITVRSRDRDDYVVESRDTDVQVGSPWPPPEK